MKILVIHSWGIGDLIMATPMLKSLHASGHTVDLALFTSTAGTNPKKVQFLAKLLGMKKVFCKAQEKDIHRIEMNLQTVDELLTKKTKEPYIFIDSDKTALIEKYIDKTGKNIGICIGSGSKQKFKRWHGYKELLKKFEGNVLVFIGPDEVELEEEFAKENAAIVKESLENTIKLISQLDLVVGNDNGLPCFDPATDKVGCTTLDCLKDLSVEEVWETCQKFL